MVFSQYILGAFTYICKYIYKAIDLNRLWNFVRLNSHKCCPDSVPEFYIKKQFPACPTKTSCFTSYEIILASNMAIKSGICETIKNLFC